LKEKKDKTTKTGRGGVLKSSTQIKQEGKIGEKMKRIGKPMVQTCELWGGGGKGTNYRQGRFGGAREAE